MKDSVLSSLKRRPCTRLDISVMLETELKNVDIIIDELLKSDLIVEEKVNGNLFLRVLPSA
jgi:hypothetical protein